MYVDLVNADDFLSSVYGNDADPLTLLRNRVSTMTRLVLRWHRASTLRSLHWFRPLLQTVDYHWYRQPEHGRRGSDQHSRRLGTAVCCSIQAGSALDGQDIELNTQTGGAWYVLNGTPNGVPDANGRVLIMQLTTSVAFQYASGSDFRER